MYFGDDSTDSDNFNNNKSIKPVINFDFRSYGGLIESTQYKRRAGCATIINKNIRE